MPKANTRNRTNIEKELRDANETIRNSEFVGEAISTVVDNQEAIVIIAFRMLTTLVVGLITVITAVLSLPFKLFKEKEQF